jgi:hypothetical protein
MAKRQPVGYERLTEKNSTAEILKKIRGTVEFGEGETEDNLSEIHSKRAIKP